MGIICPLLIGIGLIFMIKGGGDKSPLFPYVSPGLSFSGLDDAMIQTEKKMNRKKNMRFKLLLSRLNHHDAKCQPIQSVFFFLRNVGR